MWGTDGTVHAIVRSGNTIYLGGAFTAVGPNTGGGVELDAQTATPSSSGIVIPGTVNVVVPDGAGGWIVGGSFASTGNNPQCNLAHIYSNGSIAAWNPCPDGAVVAIARSASILYVAGSFAHIGGKPRRYLAALDLNSGLATDWNPDPDAPVRVILPILEKVYIGGDFSRIGSQWRNSLAAVDSSTGLALPWNPDVGSYGIPGSVRSLAAVGDTIYAGGDFVSVGGKARLLLAALDAQSGAATDWDPHGAGPDDTYYGNPYISTLAVRGHSVYVGGHFTQVGGQTRGGLAEIDVDTGLASTWNPDPGPWNGSFNRDVAVLSIRDTTILVGGYFESIGGKPRHYVAEVELGSGNASNWNPNANSSVLALAINDRTVYAGGTFTGIGSGWQPRSNLAALDATTGMLKSWDPHADGLGVWALAVGRGCVYVGGYFTMIGGKPRSALAALDTLTGSATDWDPEANNIVTTLKIAGNTIYVGGAFTSMGQQNRNRLASFALTDGALTSWDPDANTEITHLDVMNNTVYVAGSFSVIGGVPRQYGLAAVDATTGEVTAWDPQADNWVAAVIVFDSTVFVGGRFGSIGGQPRRNLAALDPTTGRATSWVADANSSVYALALIADTIIVGGDFFQIAGQPRSGLAAIDPSSGAALPWSPDLSSVEWTPSIPNPSVWTLATAGTTLYVGGMFGRVGMVPASNFAAFTFETSRSLDPIPEKPTLAWIAPNPVHSRATVRFAVPTAGAVDLAVFDVQGRRVTSLLTREPQVTGWHEVTLNADGWPRGFYFCRVSAPGGVAYRKIVVMP